MRQPARRSAEHPSAVDPWEAKGLTEAERYHHLLMGLGRHRGLRDPLAILCEEEQLTPAQLHVLVWLGYEGPLAMGVLAERAAVNEKTLTGVVDRLERDGHVERVRLAEDRRSVSVRLTDSGKRLYGRLQGEIQQNLEGLMELLGGEDRKALFGILSRLLHKLQARNAEAAGG